MSSHDELTMDRLSQQLIRHLFDSPQIWAQAFTDLGRLDDAELDRLAQRVPAGR